MIEYFKFHPALGGFVLCLAVEAVVLFVAWALCAMAGRENEKMEAALKAEWDKRKDVKLPKHWGELRKRGKR
jgi:hypothetical protein